MQINKLLDIVNNWILVFPFSQSEHPNAAAGELALRTILDTDHSSRGSLHCESPSVGATSGFGKKASYIKNNFQDSPHCELPHVFEAKVVN